MSAHRDNLIGTTRGVVSSCSREELKAEQVYVRTFEDETHTVEIDAWVGYATIAKVRVTAQQAMELAPLLIHAAGGSESDYIAQLRAEVARLNGIIEAAARALNDAAWYRAEPIRPGGAG